MSRGKSGANLEPMPFVRKWGAAVDESEDSNRGFEESKSLEGKDSKKHRHRSKSPSSSKKDKRRSSRSPDKKRHKKRSRSREGRSKKHSRSRSRDRGSGSKRNRDEREKEQISAFPPPADYLQQVQQRQQQIEMQIQQQEEAARQMQYKQEIDYGQQQYGQMTAEQQQHYYQQQQQGWDQQYNYQQPQEQQQKPVNDALSAALAAAAMVAQKLNKTHPTGTTNATTTAPTELVNKLPQLPVRTTAIAESILAKDSNGVKKELSDEQLASEQRREQRRKSRWSNTKSFVPGMPTILPANISDEQREMYLLQMDVEETTRRLRQGDFGQNLDPADRSPSPEPVYDATGKRLNTREVRKRQELEQHRHEKIQALLRINPMYKPPVEYRPPNIKLNDKVWIPQDEHPEINFVGLLIGPRGNTLKALEAETGCKIIIRGKGSIKEGKLGTRAGPLPGENEPLHAYVTATDRDAIKRGCDKIREIVSAALMIPDGQNELRKLQLRELALLNGTLRPEDILSGARCSNCGSDQHKTWECSEAPNVTANVICTACGGAGHIAKDCKNPRSADSAMIDAEYSALMAELGEKNPGAAAGLAAVAVAAAGGIRMPVPTPLGAFGVPGAAATACPRFNLPAPTQTPIVRVNLAKSTNQQQQPTGYASWAIDGPNTFYGFSGLPGQDPAAAAAAWMAMQGYSAGVPPPPEDSAGTSAEEAAASTSGSGLAMFPPPPPPPPPVPRPENEFESIYSAPPPPT